MYVPTAFISPQPLLETSQWSLLNQDLHHLSLRPGSSNADEFCCIALTNRTSEKSHSVGHSQSPTDLRSELFYEREMVSVQAIPEIERAKRNDVRVVLARNQIRTANIKHPVAGRARLCRKQTLLMVGEDGFGFDG